MFYIIHKIPTLSIIILCLPRTKHKVFKGIYCLLHPVLLKTGGAHFSVFFVPEVFQTTKDKLRIIYRL